MTLGRPLMRVWLAGSRGGEGRSWPVQEITSDSYGGPLKDSLACPGREADRRRRPA
jgi:hypothetical protein